MSARLYFAWRLLEEAGDQDERINLARMRSRSRLTSNPLEDLSEREFRNRYRISKEVFYYLCRELKTMTTLRRSQRVTLEEKVLTALFFYASGSYQRPVGVASHFSQKNCSKYIDEVTRALIHNNMLRKFINFPNNPAARQIVSQKFYTKYGIPGVVGCVDGSHFRIFMPNREVEHLYYCRKHYHSLNVQMICDSDCRILNVNPKYGGANHDSFIWENSVANTTMQSLHQNGEIVWLLGDSGYPQRPWLMTPFANVVAGSPQANYNQKHMAARVLIENTFGRLKNRWRCLNKDRVLHYQPLKCAQIIEACCVLHNICIDFGILDEDVHDHVDADPQFIDAVDMDDRNTNLLIRGRALRDQLMHRLI